MKHKKCRCLTNERLDKIKGIFKKLENEHSDLYDALAIVADDMLEASNGDETQFDDLVNTVTSLKKNILDYFEVKETEDATSIWNKWQEARAEEKPYDIIKVAKELKQTAYTQDVQDVLDAAIKLTQHFDSDFNKVPEMKDMFDYLSIIIVETIDNFYDYSRGEKAVANLEELIRVLREFQRWVNMYKGFKAVTE